MDEEATPNLPPDSTDMEGKENHEGRRVHVRREGTTRKGGGGVSLRKSLAWDKSFFTEEGILNTNELSALSRSKAEGGGRRLVSGTHEEGLTPAASAASHALSDSLGSRSKFYLRSQSKKRVASRLSSEAEASSFETPKKQIPNQSNCKGSSQSKSIDPQKKLSHACPTNPMSKIPKLRGSLAPPKAPKGEVHARKGSHNALSFASANVSQNDRRMSALGSTRKGTSSTKSHAGLSGRNSIGCNGSSSALPPRSSMHTDLHIIDASAGHKKLEPSSLSACRVNRNPSSDCHVKPSALRMPSPSLGFFVQGKQTLSHAVNSQKISDAPSGTHTNSERHIHPAEVVDGKTIKHDLAGMKKTPPIETCESTGKTSGKHGLNPSDSKYVVKEAIDPSTDLMESQLSQKSCHQEVPNKDPEYRAECESAEDLHVKNTVLGKPNISSQEVQVHRCNKEVEAIALSSLANGAYSHVDVSLEASDSCAKKDCTVLHRESLEHDHDFGENVSVSNDVSLDGESFSLFLEKNPSDGLKYGAKDRIDSKEIQASHTSSRNAETINSHFIDETMIPVCQMQCPIKNDALSIKGSSSTKLTVGQHYSTSSTSTDCTSMDSQNKMKRSISTAESTLEKDAAKQAVKLKCQLKAQPFSEDWIAAVEEYGEEILKMKTGTVQNSPPEKVPPEPSPWSPVKKNKDLGPCDCTKYTKDKIPPSSGKF